MNRKILIATVGAIALGVMAASSVAQTSKPVGLSLRVGAAWPTNGGGSNNTLFAAGAEFKISDLNLGNAGSPGYMGHLSISADYYGKNGGSAVPVLLNYVGTQNEFFYSVGAGVRFAHFSGGDTSNGFGYQLGLGFNFQQSQTPLFLEGKFFGGNNSRFDAIGVYLGIRL